MAGTEEGVTEPQATFSSCFAQPFLALHPMRYASMLADKIDTYKANAWLLNTGWVGAGAATGGKRCPLKYTRAILDAIHSGELAGVEYENYGIFNLQVPKSCPGVPEDLLNPATGWNGKADFTSEVTKLASLFNQNFEKYADQATPEVLAAGPIVPQAAPSEAPKVEIPAPTPVPESVPAAIPEAKTESVVPETKPVEAAKPTEVIVPITEAPIATTADIPHTNGVTTNGVHDTPAPQVTQ